MEHYAIVGFSRDRRVPETRRLARRLARHLVMSSTPTRQHVGVGSSVAGRRRRRRQIGCSKFLRAPAYPLSIAASALPAVVYCQSKSYCCAIIRGTYHSRCRSSTSDAATAQPKLDSARHLRECVIGTSVASTKCGHLAETGGPTRWSSRHLDAHLSGGWREGCRGHESDSRPVFSLVNTACLSTYILRWAAGTRYPC
jgi:hypothetical protein